MEEAQTAEMINSLIHEAFDRKNKIDMTAVNDLVDVLFGEMKYQVLDGFMKVNRGKKINQKHVMVRIDSLLR